MREVEDLTDEEKEARSWEKKEGKFITLETLKRDYTCGLWGTFDNYKEDDPKVIEWIESGKMAVKEITRQSFGGVEWKQRVLEWEGNIDERPSGPCLTASNWEKSDIGDISKRSITDAQLTALCTFYSIDCSA